MTTPKPLVISIYDKIDMKLSKNEMHQLFGVYNECFYHNKVSQTKSIMKAKQWLARSKTWHWFLAKAKGRIVGMAAYCYDYGHAVEFDINPEMDENICSVGVRQKYRKKGIARMLMQAMIQKLGQEKDLTLEIKWQNQYRQVLMDFYESLGFVLKNSEEKIDQQNVFLTRKKQPNLPSDKSE